MFKEKIKIINEWLEKHEIFSNLVGVFAVTAITILVTFLPFHPTQKGLRLAGESNKIAKDSNTIAEYGNIIAKRSFEASKSANKIANKALSYTKEEFKILYTPRLRAYIRSWVIYVGGGKKFGRVDDVIEIPLAVFNKSYGLAKDITLTVFYNDGTSNSKEMSQIIPVLKGGDPIVLPSLLPSILSNSQQIYLSREKTFKMKIFLTWQDGSGNRYNSVELYTLNITESYPDYPSRFVFVSNGYYNNIDNPEEFNKWENKKIDF